MKSNNDNLRYFDQEVMEGKQTNDRRYEELPWHLNEMLQEITNEQDKDRIVQNINAYYDSLKTLLTKHTTEYPGMSKAENQMIRITM